MKYEHGWLLSYEMWILTIQVSIWKEIHSVIQFYFLNFNVSFDNFDYLIPFYICLTIPACFPLWQYVFGLCHWGCMEAIKVLIVQEIHSKQILLSCISNLSQITLWRELFHTTFSNCTVRMQAFSGDLPHACYKMYKLITLSKRWHAMCIFLFLKFYT